MFWLKLVLRSVLTAVAALSLTVVLSFVTVSLIVPHVDDSPGVGILWMFVLLIETMLLIPFSLALTAELVERKAQGRSFACLNLGRRLLVLVAAAVCLFFGLWLWGSPQRPEYWCLFEILLCATFAPSVFFGLRISRTPRNAPAIATSGTLLNKTR
jgi:O-antigen/teichoic acid export membrane protein